MSVLRLIIWCLVRLPLLILILVLGLVMSSCTMLGLNYASLEVDNKPAPSPAIEAQALVNSSQEHQVLCTSMTTNFQKWWKIGQV